MTYIRVEPEEMTTTASVLQGTAGELAGLGGDVQRQCTNCCVPPTAEAQVLALAAAIQTTLTAISADLLTQAGDLATRGSTAAADSLAAAVGAASGPAMYPSDTANTFDPQTSFNGAFDSLFNPTNTANTFDPQTDFNGAFDGMGAPSDGSGWMYRSLTFSDDPALAAQELELAQGAMEPPLQP